MDSDPTSNNKKSRSMAMFYRLLVCFIFTVFMIYLSLSNIIALPLPNFISAGNHSVRYVSLQLLLAFGCMVFGYEFYLGGLKSLIKPNTDTLIAISTLLAFVYSAFGLSGAVKITRLHFDLVGIIITFMLFGKFISGTLKHEINDTIERFTGLIPTEVKIIKDGNIEKIPTSDITIGDIVVVSPGEKVPVDGVVTDGASTVDESMITGENTNASKQTGDNVYAGSINKYGSLNVKVTKDCNNTIISKIIETIRSEGERKPKTERLVSRVSSVFLSISIALAGVFSVYWIIAGMDMGFVLHSFVSVVIVFCPCTLGIAESVAIMNAVRRAAKMDIIVSDRTAFETLPIVDTIVFDKTGTLTLGYLEVVDVLVFGNYKRDEVLKYALSLEKTLQHPLGDAIFDICNNENITSYAIEKFTSVVGKGVIAMVNNRKVVLGSKIIMEENGIKINDHNNDISKLTASGKTYMLMSIDGVFAGIIVAMDKIKPGAKEVIQNIHKLGKRTIVLTGDSKHSAHFIAKELGCNDVIYDVLPNDKVTEIRKLQENGAVVAMVGDGINDAASIISADVGIFIGSINNTFVKSADIIVTQNSLCDIEKAIELSSVTIRNVKQNIFCAFICNIFLLPIAVGMLQSYNIYMGLTTVLGAAMMSMVIIALNTLRFKTIKMK